MYTKNNITYSDAGKILRSEGKVAFLFEASKDIEEIDIDVTKVKKIGKIVRVDNILNVDISEPTKKAIKTRIVAKRYDPDDQIAIILNKGKNKEATTEFNRMLEWRKFADSIADNVLKVVG